MATIDEEIQAGKVGRNVIDGLRLDVANVQVYLKKLIVCIRILVTVVLVLSLGKIFI